MFLGNCLKREQKPTFRNLNNVLAVIYKYTMNMVLIKRTKVCIQIITVVITIIENVDANSKYNSIIKRKTRRSIYEKNHANFSICRLPL